jgi:SMODS-associating 4TM effector domain
VNVSREETRRAATLQEMFDVGIFGLPSNSMAAGHRIEHHEVSRLARRYRGPESRLVDYYDIPELPRPYDVLACQHQNLAWGSRVRSRYGNLLTVALVAWSSLGLVVAAAAGPTVSQLILATRQDQVRAPEWFFRCFHRSDRADFQLAIARRFERLTAPLEEPQN